MSDVKIKFVLEGLEKATADIKKLGDSVKTMQTDLSKGMKLPAAAAKAAPGVESIREASQTARSTDQRVRQEKAGLDQINRELAKKEAQIARITRLEKEGLDVADRRVRLERELQRLQGTQQVAQTRLNESQRTYDRVRGIDSASGGKGGNGGGFGNLLSKGAIGVGIGAAAKFVIDKAIEITKEAIRSPIVTAQMQGAAIAGTTGQSLSQMQSGQFVYESMFGTERKKAGAMAQSARGMNQLADLAEITGSAGLSLLFSERHRAALFNPEKYSAMQGKEYAENRNSALEGLKSQDPFKKDALERLQANATGYLGAQRTLGLNDEGLKNFLQSSTGAGFLPEQGMQAMSSIMGAGGSTDMGINSVMALKAKRELDLNNSEGIFGTLSGSMGSSTTSKNVLIDIFAAGLDKSKYAAENSKFVQNVAEVISQRGVSSRTGADNIADQMASFATGATTMKGLENAKGAFEAMTATATTTSGRGGAVNFATIARQFPDLLKAAGGDPAVLQNMIENRGNLDPNTADFQSKLSDYNKRNGKNLTAEQYIKRTNQAGAAGAKALAPGTGDSLDVLSKDMMAYAAAHDGDTTGYDPKKSPAVMNIYQSLQARTKAYNPNLQGKTPQFVEQFLLGSATQNASLLEGGDIFQDSMTVNRKRKALKAEGEFENPNPDRNIDKINAAAAEEANISLKTLAGILGEVATNASRAAGAMSGHSDELIKAYSTYNKMRDKGDPNAAFYKSDVLEQMQKNYDVGNPLNQGVNTSRTGGSSGGMHWDAGAHSWEMDKQPQGTHK